MLNAALLNEYRSWTYSHPHSWGALSFTLSPGNWGNRIKHLLCTEPSYINIYLPFKMFFLLPVAERGRNAIFKPRSWRFPEYSHNGAPNRFFLRSWELRRFYFKGVISALGKQVSVQSLTSHWKLPYSWWSSIGKKRQVTVGSRMFGCSLASLKMLTSARLLEFLSPDCSPVN